MRKRNHRIISVNLRRRKIIIAFFLLIGILVAIVLVYMKFLINPVILRTTDSRVRTYANKSINIAIANAMDQGLAYSDLIEIQSTDGQTTMLQANSVKINALSRLITKIVQDNLREFLGDPVEIPLGAFSGIPLLSGVGPNVNITISPYGDISCKFYSDFTSAGINQTHHKIYVNIITRVHVVFPQETLHVNATADVLICESVIIGEIPQTFLQADTLGEMLPLVPL